MKIYVVLFQREVLVSQDFSVSYLLRRCLQPLEMVCSTNSLLEAFDSDQKMSSPLNHFLTYSHPPPNGHIPCFLEGFGGDSSLSLSWDLNFLAWPSTSCTGRGLSLSRKALFPPIPGDLWESGACGFVVDSRGTWLPWGWRRSCKEGVVQFLRPSVPVSIHWHGASRMVFCLPPPAPLVPCTQMALEEPFFSQFFTHSSVSSPFLTLIPQGPWLGFSYACAWLEDNGSASLQNTWAGLSVTEGLDLTLPLCGVCPQELELVRYWVGSSWPGPPHQKHIDGVILSTWGWSCLPRHLLTQREDSSRPHSPELGQSGTSPWGPSCSRDTCFS